MSVNFTPTQSAIKDLKPFRIWCQKVLPTVYDDSLSYYELLTKVVNYLNDTIDNVETLNDNVQNIYDAYILLQNYVNDYFDQNFPKLVSDKLDEMAEDGTLTALIKAYIDPYFEEKSSEIDETLTNQNETITLLNSRMDAFINQHSGLSGETLLYDGNGTPSYTTGATLALSDALANYKYLRFVWKHRGEVCVQDFEVNASASPAQNYNLRDTISAPPVQSGGASTWEMCNIVVINATSGDTNQLEIGSATVIDSTGYNDGPVDANMNTGILKVIGVKDVSDTEVVDARVGVDGTVYQNLEERLNTEFTDLKNMIQSGGGGLTADIKQAIMNCFNYVAWKNNDPNASIYINALQSALYPPVNLSYITAVYTQSDVVYNTTPLDSLKSDLVVTAHYNDGTTGIVTEYVLTGTLVVGTSTITVTYGGKTTTFNVIVTADHFEYIAQNTTGTGTNQTFEITDVSFTDGDYIECSLEYPAGITPSSDSPYRLGSNTDGTGLWTYANGYKYLPYFSGNPTVLNMTYMYNGDQNVSHSKDQTNYTDANNQFVLKADKDGWWINGVLIETSSAQSMALLRTWMNTQSTLYAGIHGSCVATINYIRVYRA